MIAILLLTCVLNVSPGDSMSDSAWFYLSGDEPFMQLEGILDMVDQLNAKDWGVYQYVKTNPPGLVPTRYEDPGECPPCTATDGPWPVHCGG